MIRFSLQTNAGFGRKVERTSEGVEARPGESGVDTPIHSPSRERRKRPSFRGEGGGEARNAESAKKKRTAERLTLAKQKESTSSSQLSLCLTAFRKCSRCEIRVDFGSKGFQNPE